MGVKPVSATLDYQVYLELRRIEKNNDIRLAELIRRCIEIGLKKIGGKDAGKE